MLVDQCPEIRDSHRDDNDDEKPTAAPTQSAPAPTTAAAEPEAKAAAPTQVADVDDTANDDGLEDLTKAELEEYVVDYKIPVTLKAAYSKKKIIGLIREAIAAKKEPELDAQGRAFEEMQNDGNGITEGKPDAQPTVTETPFVEGKPVVIEEAPVSDRIAAMRAKFGKKDEA